MSVNQSLFDLGVSHAVQLERLKSGEIRKIVKFLKSDVYPDVLDRLSRRSTVPGFGTNRLKALATSMNSIIRGGIGDAKGILRKDLNKLLIFERDFQINSITETSPIEIRMNVPNTRALQASFRKPFQGHTLGEWWNRLEKGSALELQRQLNIGVTSGDTIPQIARRVRGVLRSTNIGATRITRTAVNHISAQAREITYGENDDLIKGVQYVATLDARTTDICASLDGKVFPINEGSRPPMHHQCRSTTVPVLKGFKELGLKEPLASTRAAFNGQPSEKKTYYQWLRGQDQFTQNQALGVGKATAWRGAGRPGSIKTTDQLNRPLTTEQFEKQLARS